MSFGSKCNDERGQTTETYRLHNVLSHGWWRDTTLRDDRLSWLRSGAAWGTALLCVWCSWLSSVAAVCVHCLPCAHGQSHSLGSYSRLSPNDNGDPGTTTWSLWGFGAEVVVMMMLKWRWCCDADDDDVRGTESRSDAFVSCGRGTDAWRVGVLGWTSGVWLDGWNGSSVDGIWYGWVGDSSSKQKNETKKENKTKKCLMNVCAVSVHNVFTTTIELKGKATTRISRDCQPQVVTVYAQSSMCM